ncbi:MAG: HAD family phosphatase [Lachnospiraceae bacterium]|nr:HAD family phosphatase [Lachnospiraceae bacterium]
MQKRNNIIFDIGDVLLEYRWKDMLMEHGLSEEQAKHTGGIMFNSPLWKELDLGTMQQDEVIEAFGRTCPGEAEDIAWFLHHGENMMVPRPEIWKLMRRLKEEKGYGIYLLSNYSEKLLNKHLAGVDFLDIVDGGIISFQVKLAKPDARIYKTLLERYHLDPESCYFFDDRPENTEAARKFGIDAVTVISRQFLEQELMKLL